MTNHHDLIKQLTASAQPVTPLPNTAYRVLIWLAIALPLAMLCSLLVHRDFTDWQQPRAILAALQLVLAFSLGVLAIWNALTMSIPGRRTIPSYRFIIGGGIWLMLNIASIPTQPRVAVVQHGAFCYLFLLVVSVPMVTTLIWTLHRSRGLYSYSSLLMAGSGIAGLAVSLLSLCHPVQQADADLLMHIAGMATIILLTWLLGSIFLVRRQ